MIFLASPWLYCKTHLRKLCHAISGRDLASLFTIYLTNRDLFIKRELSECLERHCGGFLTLLWGFKLYGFNPFSLTGARMLQVPVVLSSLPISIWHRSSFSTAIQSEKNSPIIR